MFCGSLLLARLSGIFTLSRCFFNQDFAGVIGVTVVVESFSPTWVSSTNIYSFAFSSFSFLQRKRCSFILSSEGKLSLHSGHFTVSSSVTFFSGTLVSLGNRSCSLFFSGCSADADLVVFVSWLSSSALASSGWGTSAQAPLCSMAKLSHTFTWLAIPALLPKLLPQPSHFGRSASEGKYECVLWD